MAAYNLERLCVLIVEDNGYIRKILASMFRQFGFGTVDTVENGADAIEYLKQAKSNASAGSAGPDFILSDLVMTPMNGLLLLRWVRAAKESPNRFVPFLMLSGAADADYVGSARDLGMSEFLAKPFSAEQVYKRLLEIIDRPRQMVTTHSYFGPDRRRQEMGPPPGVADRRKMRDKDVTVVYSQNKVVKAKTDTDVWYFRLPNTLKEKVSGGDPNAVGEIPTDILEKAETELNRAQLDFTKWAAKYLQELARLSGEAVDKKGSRARQFEEINLLAHELRGQGGTFGYPLISTFGKMLYDLTGQGCREDDNMLEIVKAHIDTMRVVLREKISGDGGMLGRELLLALQEAIDKYS